MNSDDVLEIAKQHLHRVRRSGPDGIMAECPFHASDDPGGSITFSMSLSRGIFYCFSCHESGNLERFLNAMGVSPLLISTRYRNLIEQLRATAPPVPDAKKLSTKSDTTLPENILGLFDYCPAQLRNSGFTEQTLRAFDIGYDGKNQRITFPLRDAEGQLVGISGRKIEGTGARYKVYTTEYRAWGLPGQKELNKGSLLWNYHRAAPIVQLTGKPIIVVEGFKACMWVCQCGYPNVVALLGSKVTYQQTWLLSRLGVPLILMLDGDTAGRDGTVRSGGLLQQSSIIKVAPLTEEEDQPDNLTQQQLAHVLDNPVHFTLWAAAQKKETLWKTNLVRSTPEQ